MVFTHFFKKYIKAAECLVKKEEVFIFFFTKLCQNCQTPDATAHFLAATSATPYEAMRGAYVSAKN
jgi:hypothetical protein